MAGRRVACTIEIAKASSGEIPTQTGLFWSGAVLGYFAVVALEADELARVMADAQLSHEPGRTSQTLGRQRFVRRHALTANEAPAIIPSS
jgi:hypothetical protein